MEAISSVDEGAISDTRSNVSRIPVRKLALATALTCIVAQAVSQMGGDLGGHARNGPLGVVLGQTIWNAAQVGLLLLLLCLWRVDRHWGSIALTIGALVCLPFGIYALSPGGWLLTGLLLVTCVLTWVRNAPDLGVTIVEAPARGVATIAKFEFIAFLCNFLSTLYNYSVTRRIWPYWSNIYSQVSSLTGFTPNLATIDRVMYTLGIPGVEVPVYIKTGNDPNSVGAALFLLIWTVLPTLYILYLAALAKLAKGTPLAKLQQALCAVGIFHFLFLTDIVDYRFGRGIINAAEHPAHIIERFAFGVSIALPIHQKLSTRQ